MSKSWKTQVDNDADAEGATLADTEALEEVRGGGARLLSRWMTGSGPVEGGRDGARPRGGGGTVVGRPLGLGV